MDLPWFIRNFGSDLFRGLNKMLLILSLIKALLDLNLFFIYFTKFFISLDTLLYLSTSLFHFYFILCLNLNFVLFATLCYLTRYLVHFFKHFFLCLQFNRFLSFYWCLCSFCLSCLLTLLIHFISLFQLQPDLFLCCYVTLIEPGMF